MTVLPHPNSYNKLEELSFSPHTKCKVGGGERIANLYSPAKKLKFTKELSSGESGSGYLAGPDCGLWNDPGETPILAEPDISIYWLQAVFFHTYSCTLYSGNSWGFRKSW